MRVVSEALTQVLELREGEEGEDVYFIGTETLADDFLDAAYDLSDGDGPVLEGLLEMFPEVSREQAEAMLARNWFSQKAIPDSE